MILTQSELKSALHYDPETGLFTWISKTSTKTKIGSVAGCLTHQGYIEIQIFRKAYQSHRLAWLYVHGVWPDREVDHINGSRDDNRIINLRLATKSQNQHNRKRWSKRTSSKYKGVSFHKDTGKWLAHIQCRNKREYLGLFDTEEAAFAVRTLRAEILHKDFARN